MKTLAAIALTAIAVAGPFAARSQGLIDKGMVAGWNVMVDPQMGNGCLIQTIFEDLSVVRLGYDATHNRGYFVVFDKDWGQIKEGATYPITFDLDGETFNATATGFRMDRVPGAGVFFDDRAFIDAIAQKRTMTVFNSAGTPVIAIDLAGSAKALEYARKCQAAEGQGG